MSTDVPVQPTDTRDELHLGHFCNEDCQDSFACDRKAGLIYGLVSLDGQVMGYVKYTHLEKLCTYCNADLEETVDVSDEAYGLVHDAP